MCGDVTDAFLENTGSQGSLKLVASWFKTCQHSHAECQMTFDGTRLEDNPLLPTRSLYVGSVDSDVVKLTETCSLRGKWAALSHCWGSRQPIQTTHKNLQKNKEGILLSLLPATFRDAVQVTRALGLDYLWIDSLCIIQDDANDWDKEAPRMGQVYEHADIVIVAAWAENAGQGCFTNLTPENPIVDLPYYKGGMKSGRVFATTQQYSFLDTRPLCNRAWTIQERVLSRRAIYYTKRGPSYLENTSGVLSVSPRITF